MLKLITRHLCLLNDYTSYKNCITVSVDMDIDAKAAMCKAEKNYCLLGLATLRVHYDITD